MTTKKAKVNEASTAPQFVSTRHKAVDILSEAQDVICGERQEAYGPAEESFARIAEYWTAYTGTTITAHDAAMMMVLFKVSREGHSHKKDNLVDIAGYAALASLCAWGD
jgi:hypothetical protein